LPYGAINSVDNIQLSVACGEGVVNIEELQLAGKKRMLAADFLRGFNLNDDWKFH
jgi:methionyl-tRNA formyltransferase